MTAKTTEKITQDQLARWLPPRKENSHKGSFGHVLIVAGSKGMSGAAVLCAKAALRAGAGLTTVAMPEGRQAIVAGQVPEALTLALPETASGTLSLGAASEIQEAHESRPFSVLAIGPGLTIQTGAARAIVAILGTLAIPAIVDADALNVLSELPHASIHKLMDKRGAPVIFTPHPGEAARLLGTTADEVQAARTDSAQRLCQEFGATVLLKGAGTVVTDLLRTAINPTGNAGLAKGGSGDVLTGIIAALWAQRLGTLNPELAASDRGFEAAILGAYLHGLSADIAAREKTAYCLTASDVIEGLPFAFQKIA